MYVPTAYSQKYRLHNPEEMLYRFTYVAKFADFGEEDIKTVKASAALVGPLVPAIVDAVYEKLFSFDVTKSYFLPKVENYEGSVVASLDELKLDSEQTKFRKGMCLIRILIKANSSCL
jgi:hypothetical protein